MLYFRFIHRTKRRAVTRLFPLQLRHGERHLGGRDGPAEESRARAHRGGKGPVQLHGPGRHADPGHLHGRREWLRGERRPLADPAADTGSDTTRPGTQRGSPRGGGALQEILEPAFSTTAGNHPDDTASTIPIMLEQPRRCPDDDDDDDDGEKGSCDLCLSDRARRHRVAYPSGAIVIDRPRWTALLRCAGFDVAGYSLYGNKHYRAYSQKECRMSNACPPRASYR